MTRGDACKGAAGLHVGLWKQELACLAPVTTVICCLHLHLEDTMLCHPPYSRAFLSVTQVHIINSLVSFFLALYVHVGIQAPISHTAFLWVREATCSYSHLHNPFQVTEVAKT